MIICRCSGDGISSALRAKLIFRRLTNSILDDLFIVWDLAIVYQYISCFSLYWCVDRFIDSTDIVITCVNLTIGWPFHKLQWICWVSIDQRLVRRFADNVSICLVLFLYLIILCHCTDMLLAVGQLILSADMLIGRRLINGLYVFLGLVYFYF